MHIDTSQIPDYLRHMHAHIYCLCCISLIQFHFPGFLKSSVYLRFLNELVVMLNKPATSASLSSDSASQDHQSSSTHQEKPSTVNQLDFAQNLDDPDSLWQRPTTVYDMWQSIHACVLAYMQPHRSSCARYV